MDPSAADETKRIVFNGDDFGLSPEVNRGVLEACRRGPLRSASIVPCGRAFDEAAAIARDHPALEVGVHLTLAAERPLSDPSRIRSLVDRDGRLLPHARQFVGALLRGRISLAEVRTELEAQIRRTRRAGLAVTHLDGHQHLHLLPGVAGIVHEIAVREGIGYVRGLFAESVRGRPSATRGAVRRRIGLLALKAVARLARRAGSRTSVPCYGFLAAGRWSLDELCAVLARAPSGSELVFHPACVDSRHPYAYASWGYCWRDEVELLTSPALTCFLRDRRITPVGFGQLAGSAVGHRAAG